MAETLTIRTASSTEVIKVVERGPQGPAGVPGSGLETLTTQGDLLYRGATVGERLPIGTSGQVLKVSNGLPAWANESGAVASVNDQTGYVYLDGSEINTSASDDRMAFIASGFDDDSATGLYYPLDDLTINSKRIYKSTNGYHAFFENSRWHLTDGTPITENIVASSNNNNAAWPWKTTWPGTVTEATVADVVGRARSTFLFQGDLFPKTMISGLGTAAEEDVGAFATASHSHELDALDATGGGAGDLLVADGAGGVSWESFISPSVITGTAVVDNDARLSNSRTPTAHAASHAAGTGSDPLAPSDIGAQSIFVTEQLTLTTTAQVTLSPARAKVLTIVQYAGGNVDVVLPQSGNQNGDVFVFKWGTGSDSVIVREFAGGSPRATISAGQQKRVQRTASGWEEVPVDTHTHAATDITSGTITHERGGLEADVSAYSGLVKISGGATSAVTVTTAGEALIDDVDAAAQRTTLGLGTASTAASTDFVAVSTIDAKGDLLVGTAADTVARLPVGATNGHVLVVDSAEASGMKWAAASGGISAVGASTADVLSVSGSDLVADDGGTIDSSDPFIKWDDLAGKLVYANPLSRPSGAFYVGLAPSTTALGTRAINIQGSRSAANQVAADPDSIVIGTNARAFDGGATSRQIVMGASAVGRYRSAVAIGGSSNASEDATAVGDQASAGGSASVAVGIISSASAQATAIGRQATASGDLSLALGSAATASAFWSTACGTNITANLRGQFMTRPFGSVFWGGQTTNNTATILNLDATATNRFTIAASTALAVDILLVARRSDVADKWLVARRFLGIRRDGSNNTSLIGAVQDYGLDQSAGSPSWTFALTADDTNEALQLEVTGATSETVQWRATAIYRVV